MSTRLTTVQAHETVEDLLKLFVAQKITGVPVVDAAGKMIGVYSEYDLIKQVSAFPELKASLLREKIKFTEEVATASPDAPLSEIVQLFVNQKFRRLPIVTAEGELVGIITRRDLMRVFFFRAKLADSEIL